MVLKHREAFPLSSFSAPKFILDLDPNHLRVKLQTKLATVTNFHIAI